MIMIMMIIIRVGVHQMKHKFVEPTRICKNTNSNAHPMQCTKKSCAVAAHCGNAIARTKSSFSPTHKHARTHLFAIVSTASAEPPWPTITMDLSVFT